MTEDLFREFEVKADVREVNADGTFTGVASVYDVEDLTGDVIERGAFRKTISENPVIVILWQHDRTEPIGEGTVKEWQNKILIEGKLDIEDDPTALKAYRKLKSRRIKGLSIGFQTIKAAWEEREEDGHTRYVRRIQELKLHEVSVVTFPALPQAQVTRVKSADDSESMRSRIAELEAKVSALAATNATPPAEPAPAVEPQSAAAPEPIRDHSRVQQLIDQAKETFVWKK